MADDIVTRLLERIAYTIHPHQLDQEKLLSDAVKEIELLRDRNSILFDALRAVTNGKSVYLTESLGRTVTMDAQNAWTETATDQEARGE